MAKAPVSSSRAQGPDAMRRLSGARPEGSTCRYYKTSLFYELLTAAKIRILREALQRHQGNRTHTARALGLQRTYLIRLLKMLGMER
jgi:DNA-binding NtrC family response regulator